MCPESLPPGVWGGRRRRLARWVAFLGGPLGTTERTGCDGFHPPASHHRHPVPRRQAQPEGRSRHPTGRSRRSLVDLGTGPHNPPKLLPILSIRGEGRAGRSTSPRFGKFGGPRPAALLWAPRALLPEKTFSATTRGPSRSRHTKGVLRQHLSLDRPKSAVDLGTAGRSSRRCPWRTSRQPPASRSRPAQGSPPMPGGRPRWVAGPTHRTVASQMRTCRA